MNGGSGAVGTSAAITAHTREFQLKLLALLAPSGCQMETGGKLSGEASCFVGMMIKVGVDVAKG